MKKIKFIFVVIIGFLIFLPIICVSANSNKLVTTVDSTKNDVIITVQSDSNHFSKEDMSVYYLVNERDDLLSTHIFLKDDDVFGFIVYKSYDNAIYTLETLYQNNEVFATKQEVPVQQYEYLVEGGCSIYNESEFGLVLMNRQNTWDENYEIEEDEHFIRPYSMEQNYVPIEKMTESDSYLEGYTPSPLDEIGYSIEYYDRIVNIVPRDWFFYQGTYCYIGKEYAVYVETARQYLSEVGCNGYSIEVCVYDIEVTLPSLAQQRNASDPDVYFQARNEVNISIKPAIINSYIALYRSSTLGDYWKNHFDNSESEIILSREISRKSVYIAPNVSSIALDSDVPYNAPGKSAYKIRTQLYQMKEENSLSTEIKQIKRKSFFVNAASKLVSIAGGIPGKISSSLINVVNSFATSYATASTENLAQDLAWQTDGVGHYTKYEGYINSYNEQMLPIAVFQKHNSYSSIFSNRLLRNYEHIFNYELNFCLPPGPSSIPLKEHFYSLILSNSFDFYDANGNVLYTKSHVQEYEHLGYAYEAAQTTSDGKPLPYTIANGSSIPTNITAAGTSRTVIFQPLSSGMYSLLAREGSIINANIKMEIYNMEGNLLSQTRLSGANESTCIVKLEAHQKYLIFIRSADNRTPNININFKTLTGAETIIGAETLNQPSYSIAMDSSSQKVFYYRFNLVRDGVYRFIASSGEDTTIRIYDSNGKLLQEGFDPNVDWSDDVPDLDACLTYYSRGHNKEIILEVTIDQATFFSLNCFYQYN